MKDLFITETIEDIDKNNDGFISLEEFLGDMWDSTENNNTAEPDWIKSERENFRNYRDLDHDGKMNRKEVELWLMPTDYDNIQAETAHLFREADQNQVNNIFLLLLYSSILFFKDDQLTKEEILDKHDVFVGSQATDYGAELKLHSDL
jgi:hypothetical protein